MHVDGILTIPTIRRTLHISGFLGADTL